MKKFAAILLILTSLTGLFNLLLSFIGLFTYQYDFNPIYGEVEGMKWELLLESFDYNILGSTTMVLGSMVELFLFLSLLILGFSLFSKKNS
tara:strand:+ start:2103 stop:2375 length:273 start_codon:yes stop_codon:yes gene_type:complete